MYLEKKNSRSSEELIVVMIYKANKATMAPMRPAGARTASLGAAPVELAAAGALPVPVGTPVPVLVRLAALVIDDPATEVAVEPLPAAVDETPARPEETAVPVELATGEAEVLTSATAEVDWAAGLVAVPDAV